MPNSWTIASVEKNSCGMLPARYDGEPSIVKYWAFSARTAHDERGAFISFRVWNTDGGFLHEEHFENAVCSVTY